jgi:hypothetical protein
LFSFALIQLFDFVRILALGTSKATRSEASQRNMNATPHHSRLSD